MPHKLIILTGPSCAGKTPMLRAFFKLFPEKKIKKLILYNNRKPRPTEIDGIDYFFRTTEKINLLKNNKDYSIIEARSDIQAINKKQLCSDLKEHDVIFEGNPFVAEYLLRYSNIEKISKLSIFISPLSKEEILFFKNCNNVNFSELISDIIRKRLLKRTKKLIHELSLQDLEQIEIRAKSAYNELKSAYKFDYIIPNHDGEESDNWDFFYYPIGDARKSVLEFADIILHQASSCYAETWGENLIP